MPPHLIALALVGGAGWFAWRELRRHLTRLETKDREKAVATRPGDRLERGPDGVYRPSRDVARRRD